MQGSALNLGPVPRRFITYVSDPDPDVYDFVICHGTLSCAFVSDTIYQ
jgi:hypothetical protein